MITLKFKDRSIPSVVNALYEQVHKQFPDKTNSEKAAMLGRSYQWYITKGKFLGFTNVVRSRHSIEDFYTMLDNIPLNQAVIIKDYAFTTVRNYVSKYCSLLRDPLKYKLSETKAGITLKLFKRK